MRLSTRGKPQVQQCTPLPEAISDAAHITFEIGPGLAPLACVADGPNFDEHNLYIGWNIDSRQHAAVAEENLGIFENVRTPGIYSLHVPFTKTVSTEVLHHVPASSVDVVLMGNVLGERRSSGHYGNSRYGLPRLNPTGLDYRGSTNINQKAETLRIAENLLKLSGTLVIFETLTPWQARVLPDEREVNSGFYSRDKTIAEETFKSDESSMHLEDEVRFATAEAHFRYLARQFAPLEAVKSKLKSDAFIQIFRKL